MHGTPARGDYQYFDNVRRDQELRLMRRKVAEYESGEAIVREKERTEKWRCRYEREVKARKKDAAEAERERKRTAKMWQDANEDVHAENEELRAKVERMEARMQKLEERNAELEQQNSDLTAANRTLVHRLGRNHTNSHVPSSGDRPGASVSSTKRHDNNSRAKTDRKPGGQPGHPHHARKKLTPTAAPVVHSEPPEGIDGNSEWYMTDEYVERDEVNARVTVEVIPHRAMIWKNRRTGETRVSPFPEGLHDETNYSRQTEAVVLMLTHVAHVATRKVKQLLYELTDGVLDVSVGWIAGLPKKFSARSSGDLDLIFRALFMDPVMHVDSTVTKVNGKREAVNVACSESAKAVLYTHTKKKGHEAANTLPCRKGSGYEGTVCSDREAAFIKLGETHQLCLAHISRDLQDVISMEKCAWAEALRSLIGEMIDASHTWQGPDAVCEGPTEEQVRNWKERYDEILKRGRTYYCENPPTRHYLKGHNLRVELSEEKDKVLLFLHDTRVPPTNNMAERCLRNHKRALHQAVTFRSSTSVDERCDVESIIQTTRLRDMKILPVLTEILSRPVPES